MPFLRNLSALLILSLALAGCVAERPSGPEMSQLAPAAATAYRIIAAAAGPVTGGVAFSRSRLQELFPGREIQTIGLANEDRTFYGFVVFDQGLQALAIEPDGANRAITAVHGVGPAVAGPNGETIGMGFAGAGIAPRSCRIGRNLWAGMAICPARNAPNVSLVFFDGSWDTPPDRLPPPSELASGRLQRIVWKPPTS